MHILEDEVYYSGRTIRREGDFVTFQYERDSVATLPASAAYLIRFDTKGAFHGIDVEIWLLTDDTTYCDLGQLSQNDAKRLAGALGIRIRPGAVTGDFPKCVT